MKNYFITSGTGCGKTELNSFDSALFNSGVANYNLVRISSILPADAKECDAITLEEGELLHTAYASISTNCLNKTVSAAIAVGIPVDNTKIGVIMEFSDNCTKEVAENKVSEMVVEAMKMRNYEIKEIKVLAVEAISEANSFVTAFAGLAIW